MNNYLEQLIQFAKEENWEAMNALIPQVCDNEEFIHWSLNTGLKDENDNVRDLAVLILEKSHYPLTETNVDLLETLMQTDKNMYVQFRAAFTLYNRGMRSDTVMSRMHEALLDEDVKDIAAKYLGGNI